ncbi:MAG: transposase [Bacteroidales bacterium]
MEWRVRCPRRSPTPPSRTAPAALVSRKAKAEAVRLVLDEGQRAAVVARDLEPTGSALRTWVDQARRADPRQDRADESRARGVVAPPEGESDPARGARNPKRMPRPFFAKHQHRGLGSPGGEGPSSDRAAVPVFAA